MTTDINTANEQHLEAQREDFYGFLKETDWTQAQAIVDNLYDIGATAEAVYLRKALLNAQKAHLDEKELTHFAPEDNPLNGVKVEGHAKGVCGHRCCEGEFYEEESELNPNRGDAPY